MSFFDLAKLYGGSECMEFPSNKPNEPIKFWFHNCTEEEKVVSFALAKVQIDETGSAEADLLKNPQKVFQAVYQLASFCIDRVENFDLWSQSEAKELGAHGLMEITEGQRKAIPREVMIRIGQHLLNNSGVSEEEKKD